jgi:prepilin-type N-terminal cleavage/methylation domain-containing protein
VELSYKLNKKGFSLLELIVSMAILSVGIIMVLQALSFSVRVTGLSGDIIRAVFLAQDKIQELEFKERQGLIKQEPAEAEGKQEKFQWNYQLALNPDLNLYQLNFLVSWQRANRKEEIAVNTYLK